MRSGNGGGWRVVRAVTRVSIQRAFAKAWHSGQWGLRHELCDGFRTRTACTRRGVRQARRSLPAREPGPSPGDRKSPRRAPLTAGASVVCASAHALPRPLECR
jgi:hypothetical protein